jgi:hypothetical protein
MYIWGKLDETEEVWEYEPIERFKWSESESNKFIYTGFYNCNVLTITSRLSKMLSGEFMHNAGKSQVQQNKKTEDIHTNTLYFINLSLNNADQNRKISYRPEGLPKKSEAEERKHRELVYQTK